MLRKILGGLAGLWGIAIVMRWFEAGGASSAHAADQLTAAAFGGTMFLLGVYYLFKKPPVDRHY